MKTYRISSSGRRTALIHPERRVLAQVKNNLAGPQASLEFSFSAAAGGVGALTWHGPCA